MRGSLANPWPGSGLDTSLGIQTPHTATTHSRTLCSDINQTLTSGSASRYLPLQSMSFLISSDKWSRNPQRWSKHHSVNQKKCWQHHHQELNCVENMRRTRISGWGVFSSHQQKAMVIMAMQIPQICVFLKYSCPSGNSVNYISVYMAINSL